MVSRISLNDMLKYLTIKLSYPFADASPSREYLQKNTFFNAVSFFYVPNGVSFKILCSVINVNGPTFLRSFVPL